MATSWTSAEPAHLLRERADVAALAPDLRWTENLSSDGRSGLVGWVGALPAWCAERSAPEGLDLLLGADRLGVRVVYREATPMVPPAIFPESIDVPLERRTDHSWHVNGDGSLCLLQAAGHWQPGSTAAPLLIKASCWYVEYRLREAGRIDAMSERGLADDSSFDHLIADG